MRFRQHYIPIRCLAIFVVVAQMPYAHRTHAKGTEANIDAILHRAHSSASVQPVPLIDDSLFLRRLTLDLIGRVPTANEIQDFANRENAVDKLLASEDFDTYWSQLWTSILVGRNTQRSADRESLRAWLEESFQQRKPFDQVAFDLISAQGVTSLHGPVNFLVGNREDPVTSVARVFLGVQLDCARCHDHPYDRWTEEDYGLMRRFFDVVQFDEVSGGIKLDDEGRSPRNDDELPRFLTGARPRTSAWRREMAFMTVRSKPFARSIGNRVWQLLMGRGIVDPIDGLSEQDRPSVPALHDALAKQLKSQRFDIRSLIRNICLSDAYRRKSIAPDSATDQRVRLFAARQLRALLPEQLIRSYNSVMQSEPLDAEEWNEQAIEFLGRSAAATGSSDPLRNVRTSQGLLAELAMDVQHPIGDLESIFLSTLSRRPNAWETRRLADASRQDTLYALLHCNEFVFCR